MKKLKNSSKNFDYFERKNHKKHISTIIKVLISIEVIILFIALFLIGRWSFKGKEKNIEEVRLTAASVDHSAWIMNGKLYIAGEPYDGQDTIKTWDHLVQVAISDDHIIALDHNGVAHAAGSNASLQCEINGLENVRYIEAGMNCSVGVMDDGTIQIFGIMDESWREELLREKSVQTVSMGDNHIAVMHDNGTVTAYGNNESGECNVEEWKNIRQIAVGYAFTVGLTEKGRVLFTGDDSYNPNISAAWENISRIEAGSSHTVGIDKNGNVFSAGLNTQGQCNVSTWKKITSIAAGYDHTIGLNENGEAFAVGFNGNGQCDV